jgi:hypothetical protein
MLKCCLTLVHVYTTFGYKDGHCFVSCSVITVLCEVFSDFSGPFWS